MRKRVATRKILIAGLGVGAVSYVSACGGSTVPTGTSTDAASDVAPDVGPTSGNLMAMPPPDAGEDVNATDAPAADVQDAQSDISTSGNLMGFPVDSGDDGG
jgi:hypothetical protein